MKIKPRHYPYPVLSYFSNDFIDSYFKTIINADVINNKYVFNITFELKNSDLENLIALNKAKFSVHIECGNTRFRNLFSTFENKHLFDIPSQMLDGLVQICPLIVATEEIPEYKNNDLHPDFENSSFSIKKGDVLAIGLNKKMIVEKENSSDDKIPSIFRIIKDRSKEAKPVQYNLYSEKITIILSSENFSRFSTLSHLNIESKKMLSTMIIIPALTGTIEALRNANTLDDYEDKRWFNVLIARLKDLEIDIENGIQPEISSFSLAVMLLGDPFSGSLKTFENIMNER